MKISGYEALWMVFWICLFSYWGFKFYLNNELEIAKLQNQKEIAEMRKDSNDKMTKSLESITRTIAE